MCELYKHEDIFNDDRPTECLEGENKHELEIKMEGNFKINIVFFYISIIGSQKVLGPGHWIRNTGQNRIFLLNGLIINFPDVLLIFSIS